MVSQDKIDQIRTEADKVEDMWNNHVESCEICRNWDELGKVETYGLKCVEGYINRENSVLYMMILDKLGHFER